jgi:hypothetical protein
MAKDELLPIPKLEPPVMPEGIGRYRIALIIDGVVHSVLMLEGAEAARYLSEPTFVQIPRSQYVEVGFKYDGVDFNHPETR